MLARREPMEETGYNPRKTAMVVPNLSRLPEMILTWKQPIQESNYQPSKAAMVVYHSVPAVLTDLRSLPTQEADYNQTKSVMVITGPALPTLVPT